MGEEKQASAAGKEFTHTFTDQFEDKEVTVSCRLRKPTRQQIARAQKQMIKKPGEALKTLVLDVVAAEDKERLVKDLDSYPGIGSTFGNALLTSAGFGDLGN